MQIFKIFLFKCTKNLGHSHVNSTVITGVVMQENDSSIVQIFARKPMRRWRYKMDVYVDGMRRFTDKAHWKFQQFNGNLYFLSLIQKFLLSLINN